jgi:3D (Asp-Asp-Asp) domain-containing protein
LTLMLSLGLMLGDIELPEKKIASVIPTFEVEATAYTALCPPVTINGVHYKGCSGITYTGLDVRDDITYHGRGIIAVDPKVIPLYSIVEIEGYEYIALDTGGAIKGNKIDILMQTEQEAKDFGRRKLTIKVVGSVHETNSK